MIAFKYVYRSVSGLMAVFALLGLTFPLLAQRTTASIAGQIRDVSGAAVPEASIVIRHVGTGIERTVSSSEDGNYVATALPAGTYAITVRRVGFQIYNVADLTLQVDQQATLNVELQVGSVTDTVNVTADAAAVDVRSATLNTVINQTMINDLPLNGRNVLQLMRLTPGTLSATGTWNQGSTRPEAASELISSSGGRGNSTTFVMDGGLNEDPYTEVANVVPNPDAVQEFSFQTNNYGAKFGGRGGGVVNIVTRSGSNALHGSAFEYLRNANLNARNFFANRNDGLKRNQFGFSLGGPIRQNKTFFFGSYQGTEVRQDPPTQTAVVPTAAQRRGDFSRLPRQLTDPRTGQPYPGNVIPSTQFDPVALKVLELVPVAPADDGLVYFQRRTTTSDNQFLVRGDHYFNTEQHLSLRYFFDRFENPAIIDPKNILTANNSRFWSSHSAVANYTYTVRPNLLTNTTLSYSRVLPTGTSPDFPGHRDLGIQLNALSNPDYSVFSMSITNYFGCRGTRFQNSAKSVQPAALLVVDKGRHQLDFGFDAAREQSLIDQDFQSDGNFVFGGRYSGDNFADFLVGKPSAFNQITPLYVNLIRNLYGLYVQDDFKVNRNLTLNLGLRWNPFVPFTDIPANQISQFDQGAYDAGIKSQRFANLSKGHLVAGDPGVPRSGVNAVWGLIRSPAGISVGCLWPEQDVGSRRTSGDSTIRCRR